MANPTIYGNGTTTASNGANTVTHFYDRAGIKAANASNIYSQFADRKSMPQKMGKTYKISKWQHMYDLDQSSGDFATKGYLGKRDLTTVSSLLAATDGSGAGISEGVGAINKVTPKKVTVEATLARYGYMIEYTDEVALFSEDPVQVKYREELGYLMNQTFEDLVQKDMISGAGININASGVATAQLGSTIAADDTNAELYKVSYDLIRNAVKALKRNRAQHNTEIVTGSNKIGTKPINKAFYAIVGPEVKYDLESLTRGASYATEFAYIPAYQYAAASNLAEGEVGSMQDVRFIESEGAMMEAGAGAPVPAGYVGDLSYTADSASLVIENTTASAIDITGVVTDNPYGTSIAAGAQVTAATEADAALLDAVSGLDRSEGKFDVFPIIFPTKGSFATVGLKGSGRINFYSKNPSEVSLSNPHGTRGFFSANMFYAGLALQPEKLACVRVLATR